MAEQDWAALSGDLKSLLGAEKTSGDLWAAWKHAKDVDHDEYSDWAQGAIGENSDKMWDYYDDMVSKAESAYGSLHATWLTHFYKDRDYITATKYRAEKWDDEIADPLRNEPTLMGKSEVAESWYGPSAQKYATALQTQTSAMAEINTIAGAMGTAMNNARMNLQGIMLAIKESCEPVKDQLNSCEKRSWIANQFHVTFMENVTYGKVQFESLESWLLDIAESGDWKTTMEDSRRQLEDLHALTEAFGEGKWPKATTGDMKDMDNGSQTPPGGAPTGPPPGTTPGAPYTPVDTNSDGTPVENHTEESYNKGVNNQTEEHDDVDPNAE